MSKELKNKSGETQSETETQLTTEKLEEEAKELENILRSPPKEFTAPLKEMFDWLEEGLPEATPELLNTQVKW